MSCEPTLAARRGMIGLPAFPDQDQENRRRYEDTDRHYEKNTATNRTPEPRARCVGSALSIHMNVQRGSDAAAIAVFMVFNCVFLLALVSTVAASQ